MEANFRNLAGRPLELWLGHLAAEHYAAGQRVLIRAGSTDRVRVLDQALWTYDSASFVPHGTAESGRPEAQPVFLTDGEGNPNGATRLLLVDLSPVPVNPAFDGIDYIFERADPAGREAARLQWRAWKDQGHEPIYWQASADGWQRAG